MGSMRMSRVRVSKRAFVKGVFAFMCGCRALGLIAEFKNTIGLGI
jgi:hypothetical protein